MEHEEERAAEHGSAGGHAGQDTARTVTDDGAGRRQWLPSERMPSRQKLGFVFLVGLAAAAAVTFGMKEEVAALLEWTQAQGSIAPLLFVAALSISVLLLVPGVVFTTGAGFLYGVVWGAAYVVIGTTIGATLAFLIARYTFGDSARRNLRGRMGLHAVSQELASNGWKVVLLTRLIPFFPGKLSNYFFGVTPVSLRGYVFGTFFGLIPFSIHNAYLGSLAADITAAELGHGPESPLGWATYVGGFLVTVCAVAYIGNLARVALSRRTCAPEPEDADRPCRG